MSACINPIIYVTMNRQYRDAYKSVLCCWQWQSDGRNNLNSVTGKSKERNNKPLKNTLIQLSALPFIQAPTAAAAALVVDGSQVNGDGGSG